MKSLLTKVFAKKTPTIRRQPRLAFESLGDRTLMSATFNVADGILRVDGTDQSETIRIVNSAGQVSVAGESITVTKGRQRSSVTSLPAASIAFTRINGFAGNDRIEMVQMDLAGQVPVILEALGGAGKDTLVGGSAADRLFGGDEVDQLVGGAGDDQLDGGGQQDIAIDGPAIDATKLLPANFMVDGAYLDSKTPFAANLSPGDHYIYTYGGIVWFKTAEDGTFNYDPALEGILTGQGTSSLNAVGVEIHIDASQLLQNSMCVDYVTQDMAAPVSMNVLPGEHFVYVTGSIVWFHVDNNGIITYDESLDGVLTGRGTNSLILRGAEVHIDASAIDTPWEMSIDYVQKDSKTPVTARVLPGNHFVYTIGAVTWFTVDNSGTISYDPSLEGVVTGQGTNSLTLHGAEISVDASKLFASSLSLDYMVHDSKAPVAARLMPGSHFVYTTGSIVWFQIGNDGIVSYDATLEGIVSGSGTNALALNGKTIPINPTVMAETAINMNYLAIDSSRPFEVNLLPGSHFIYTGAHVYWFTVGLEGVTEADPALNGVFVPPASAALGADRVLRIKGTDGADNIHVVQMGELLWIDGMSIAMPNGNNNSLVSIDNVDHVEVVSLNGNDIVRLESMGVSGRAVGIKVFGGDGSDTLTGGQGDDTLIGGNDHDRILGMDGNDTLIGCHYLWAGESGFWNDDTIYGGKGNDSLFGGDAGDLLVGEEGNDSLKGDGGNDTLWGGAENDSTMHFTDDTDTLTGDAGFDILYGGGDKDTIFGGTERDLLFGSFGSDLMYGDDDDDELSGGPDSDTMRGGNGPDKLWGDEGSNDMAGEAGDDELYGRGYHDTLDGGTGKDLLDARGWWNTYRDNVILNSPFLRGEEILDVDQARTPTCQTLCSIAAARRQGHDFSNQITNLGNNWYRVRLYPKGVQTDVDVYFDGTWTDTDAWTGRPNGDDAGNYWVILLQRARLQLFGIQWTDEMFDLSWEVANNDSGGLLFSADDALQTLTGKATTGHAIADVSWENVRDWLNSGVILDTWTPALAAGAPLVGKHCYAITDAWTHSVTRAKIITLYNPWGSYQDITWTDFMNNVGGVVSA